MSEAAAATTSSPTSAAPTSAPSQTQDPNLRSQAPAADPQPWEPPKTREDFERIAREFALNEPETRKINGKEVTKSRAEWARYAQQLEGINDKHALTVDELKRERAFREQAEAALRDPRAFLEFLATQENGLDLFDKSNQLLNELRQLSPEQRAEMAKREEMERKAKEYERFQEQQRAQQEEAQYNADMDRHAAKIEAAFQKVGWNYPPEVEPLVDLVSTTLLSQAITNNDSKMTYTALAEATRSFVIDAVKAMAKTLPPQELQGILGVPIPGQNNPAAAQVQAQIPRQTQPRDPASGKYVQGEERPRVQVYSPGTGQFARLIRS